jgi:hypothetical protein
MSSARSTLESLYSRYDIVKHKAPNHPTYCVHALKAFTCSPTSLGQAASEIWLYFQEIFLGTAEVASTLILGLMYLQN